MRAAVALFMLVVLLSARAAPADTTVLQQGRIVRPYAPPGYTSEHPYMNCDDTYVSAAAPDMNFGGARELVLQPGKTKVLVRFTQLNWALGVDRVITKATLVLVPTQAGQLSTGCNIRMSALKRNWGEGSGLGGANYWGTTWNQRFSSTKGNGRPWTEPGLKANDDYTPHTALVDPLKSLTSLATLLPREEMKLEKGQEVPTVLVIQSERLAQDVQSFYDRHYTNFGWVIELLADENAPDRFEFYSSQSKQAAFRPMLILETSGRMPVGNAMDLDVTYIERTPEYRRYAPSDPATGRELYEYKTYHGPNDVSGILKKPLFMDEKKWPDEGEEVTFIAHVKNGGKSDPTGPFTYAWYVNEQQVDSGTYEGADQKGLKPGEETTFSVKWPWQCDHADHRDQTVTFSAEPVNQSPLETTKNNNQLTDYIEAMNFGYFFHTTSYDELTRYEGAWGSYSPEDWVQWQWNMWNETVMAKSRYLDLAPDGCLERVRVQDIVVVPDDKLKEGEQFFAGRTNFYHDGEWASFSGESPNETDAALNTKALNPALIHEATHQLGVIDNYASNMHPSRPDGEGGNVHFALGNGRFLTCGYADYDGGIMGGGHTRPAPDQPPYGGCIYSEVTVGGLNSSLGKRRGFFGDYTYDLPEQLTIVVQDWAGKPIPNAEVTVFQSAASKMTDQYVVASGKTNERGEIVVPPQPTMEDGPITVATGHTLRPNPWGRVNVVGFNGSLMIRVKADGQTDYRFLKNLEANVAYWKGAKDNWNCPLPFVICQGGVKGENVAKGASIWAQGMEPNNISNATDGDPKTCWEVGTADGSWFEVDLGKTRKIGKIEWVGLTGGASFDIMVSENGRFQGEEKRFCDVKTFPTYLASWPCYFEQHNEPCEEEPSVKVVPFTGEPTTGRYIRFVPTEQSWFRLNELRVYECAQ
jgi:hypothetical protein